MVLSCTSVHQKASLSVGGDAPLQLWRRVPLAGKAFKNVASPRQFLAFHRKLQRSCYYRDHRWASGGRAGMMNTRTNLQRFNIGGLEKGQTV